MSEATHRFLLPFILPGQAQKELFHNEALASIDLLLHPAIEDGPLDTPPMAPEEGQCWLVGSDPEGAWEDQMNSLALWTAGGWRFASPLEGFDLWNKATGLPMRQITGGWTSALAAASIEVDGVQVLGERQPAIASPSGGTVIDTEARAAIAALIVSLQSHGLIE